MIAQNYKEQDIRWDTHRKFHVVHHANADGIRVTQFTETGEYVINTPGQADVAPALRREYAWTGVAVYRVTDALLYQRFALHTPDGEPVKRAWLEAGRAAQLLLCDYACDRAVLLHHPRHLLKSHTIPLDGRPEWTYGLNGVYYNTAASMPQPLGPVLYDRPAPQTLQQKRHVASLKAAADAWKLLTADEVQYVGETFITFKAGSALDQAWRTPTAVSTTYPRPFVRSGGLYPSELYGKTLGDLDYHQLATLAYRGVTPDRAEHQVPYLTLTRQG